MALSTAWKLVAAKLAEAAAIELTSSDVCRWLSDACRDMEGYGYYVDHIGDGESGDVIYCCDGNLKRAPYEIRQVNGKSTATIDDENAIDVLPRTVYEPEADEADHYASMEAQRLYQPGAAKLAERFISKAERDNADSGSFAGKGKSFPILKPGDVKAAVSSMGRAGSDNYDTGTLKRNIIRIAKKKGFTSSLPKAWQSGGDSSEAAVADIDIVGDVIPLKEGAVGQDGTAYLKLIAPGRGSSGFYPAEVLKRDGPTVFQKGTKNFWNHQTDAEESARPEGDLRDLASVLTEDAHYEDAGPAGPGLYARAKVFENFRQPVDDLAKHIGMSIRASGKAKEGKAPDGKTGPIIEQLTRGISVDYVTTPGAGGQILQLFEAVRNRTANSPQGGDPEMDADMKKLLESNRKLSQRLALREARDSAAQQLEAVRLPDATKTRLIERLVGMAPITAEGDLDAAAFKKLLEAEVKEEASYLSSLTGGRIVTGMGDGQGTQPTADELKAREKQRKEDADRLAITLGFSGKEHKVGRKILREGRVAFDPNYNSALNGVGVTVED